MRQYIGARYVPTFADPLTWDNSHSYEALMMVDYMGDTYTSKKPVPAGIAITNTDYWVMTGSFNSQLSEIRTTLDNFIAQYSFVQAEDYGAVFDGITDDSAAIQSAINAGNVMFPHNKACVINSTVNIPDGRILDLNGCTITTNASNVIFQIGTTGEVDPVTRVTIKNGLVNLKNGLSFIKAINTYFINIEDVRVFDATNTAAVIFDITNTFNFAFNRCYIFGCIDAGYSQIGIKIIADSTVNPNTGTSNITNVSINDCLVQSFNTGIYLNCTNGSMNEVVINNIGFSLCDGNCIKAEDYVRNLLINGLRAENSGYVIKNINSSITLIDAEILNSHAIDNAKIIKIEGNLSFDNYSGNTKYVLKNTGVADFSGCIPDLTNATQIESNTGTIMPKLISKPVDTTAMHLPDGGGIYHNTVFNQDGYLQLYDQTFPVDGVKFTVNQISNSIQYKSGSYLTGVVDFVVINGHAVPVIPIP